VRREFESGIPDRKAHPIATLTDCRIREAHHREGREAERDVYLNLNGIRLDTEDRGGSQSREHVTPTCKPSERKKLRDFSAVRAPTTQNLQRSQLARVEFSAMRARERASDLSGD